MTDTITDLTLADLQESPFNPRKLFDDGALQQLATDIKAQGRVLQPLLVRPIVPPLFRNADGSATEPAAIAGFEIVFGHRRFRAAAIAGLTEVPCMVRAMLDDEARRAQISENLSREDVHPIEEAEGFQALLNTHTADEIAAEFGKSRSYVYGRLKLLQACPEIRRACLAGEIGSEVALLVARLRSPKLQEKALGYIKADYRAKLDDGGKASYRSVRDLLNEKFALYLKRAMFDPEEEMLLPVAGNCITCPKRSGNAPEYQDVVADEDTSGARYGSRSHGGPDVCTDPDCYAAKTAAWLKRDAARLGAEGRTVVTGNAARGAISATGQVKGAYVPLAEVRKQLAAAQRNAQKDAKVVPPFVVLIQDPRTGKTVEAVKRAELKSAGAEVAKPKRPSNSYGSDAYAAAQKKNGDEAKQKTAANVLLWKHVRNELHGSPLGLAEVRAVAASMFDYFVHTSNAADYLQQVWDEPNNASIAKRVELMDGGDLTRLIMDCVLLEGVRVSSWQLDARPEPLDAAARRLGLDPTTWSPPIAEAGCTPAAAAHAPVGVDAAQVLESDKQGQEQDQKDEAGFAGGGEAAFDLVPQALAQEEAR